MATKKKDIPTDPESKADSFHEAQRQDQRAGELWDRSSPTMQDMFAAVEDFRNSFDAAQKAVDGFVAESKRVSAELRREQCEARAETFARWADDWAGVTSPAFEKAAKGIVDLVHSALIHGYPDLVLKAEGPILDRGLGQWGTLCDAQRALLRTDAQVLSPDQRGARRSFAISLIDGLKRIHESAAGLTLEQVIEAANNRRTTTGAGFAAELACMCGAFGYGPENQEKVQDAIRKAMRRG
jgi:hypothetical protein